MSSGSPHKKKRNTSELPPAPNGDHRKRRRNRTTQSCFNCHISKRMCDRKRPACARCTQLGLTGLCGYEIDDPTQRTETQDENSRLTKRVAELEGVIRELKNKPHPRWVQASTSDEKWRARLHSPAGREHKMLPNFNAPPSLDSSSENDLSSRAPTDNLTCVPVYNSFEPGGFPATIDLQACTNYSLYKNSQESILNTPFPLGLLTDNVGVADKESLTLPQDYDLASMFLTYPDVMECTDNSPSYGAGIFDEEHGRNCGCLDELSNYHVILELSLRLRKASDILSHSPIHQLRGFHFCLLHQIISNLDNFMAIALSDITTTVENLPGSLMLTDQWHQVPTTNEKLTTPTLCPSHL